jgi:tetratricopeptide (TPR) repeat protein
VIALLDLHKIPPSIDLLRTAAEACIQIGDVDEGVAFLERALLLMELAHTTNITLDAHQHAATLLTYGRTLVDRGQPDRAVSFLEQAQRLLPADREKAIVLGDIARIRARKGEVDAALELHREAVKVYEGLGDKRSRAVTLGDIARIRAGKGEVDAALELHQERLEIFEGLGDKDGLANALWSIANMQISKKEFELGLENLIRSYQLILPLGRLDGICVIGLDLGQLLCYAGRVDEEQEVLTRSREGFLRLGWTGMAERAEALIQECAEQSA